jgi:hypothetical protein
VSVSHSFVKFTWREGGRENFCRLYFCLFFVFFVTFTGDESHFAYEVHMTAMPVSSFCAVSFAIRNLEHIMKGDSVFLTRVYGHQKKREESGKKGKGMKCRTHCVFLFLLFGKSVFL